MSEKHVCNFPFTPCDDPIHVTQTRITSSPPTIEFVTKDSGKRESHSTGAVRDDRTGKGRYDLVSPLMLHRLAQLYERGAIKYAARNWEKGMPLSRYFDSGARHAYNYLEGKRDEDHLAAAVWNFGAMIHTEEMIKRRLFPKEFADMPSYQTVDQRIDLGDGFRL